MKLMGSKKLVVLLFFVVASSVVFLETLLGGYHVNVKHQLPKFLVGHRNIVYPTSFSLIKNKQELLDHYNIYFNQLTKLTKPFNIFKYTGSRSWLPNSVKKGAFHSHAVKMYEEGNSNCKQNKPNFNLEISAYTELDAGLDDMVRVFQRQLAEDPAFKELKPFFKSDIDMQFKEGDIGKHWYKFAGTSVWLENLGVHMMISRVLYSTPGSKRKPIMSLTYAQIFNEQWEELKDTELIIPTRDELGELEHKNIVFPKFLPIPFYHNEKLRSKVFYGPEDPRLFLIKNEYGDFEPLIIYNSYHRKITDLKFVENGEMNLKFGFYRSMFLSWPFRFQKGKTNVDGLANDKTDNLIYNRAVELRRSDSERLAIQKNWTPLLNHGERESLGYDKHIYFVYRWSQIEVLKCSLNNFIEGTSECSYDYKRKVDSTKDEVGPLRGGTEMINIRDIVKDKRHLPNKEIWIGFPRAHIKKCGCGSSMYRPNLAVITKESDDRYKLSQLSSFFSLDIEVAGWTNPNIVCARRDPDALIPNGISGWDFHGKSDYLTLSLSVADATNHLVHIKNLLVNLMAHTDMLVESTSGFDDEIVDCALKESTKFCANYGKQMKQLGKTPPPEPDY